MNRRSLLRKLHLLPLAFYSFPDAAGFSPPSKPSKPFEGELLTIGEGEHGFTKNGDFSLLTQIKLDTGKINQTVVPIKFGHMADAIDKDHILASGYKAKTLSIVDRRTFKHKAHLKLPKGYISTGHFCSGSNEIYISLSPKKTDYLRDRGAIGVFKKNFKFIKMIELPGYPHDLKLVREKLLVTPIVPKKSKTGYSYEPNKGSVFFIDTESGKIIRSHNPQINATPTHLGVYSEEHVFVGTAQYINIDERKLLDSHLKKIGVKSNWFPISSQEYKLKRIGISTPILKVGMNSSQIKSLPEYQNFQRRQLSFAVNKKAGKVYVTCSSSNTLLCLDAISGVVKSVNSGFELGLSNIQGLCLLPDNILALSDSTQGIILYSPNSRKVLKKFDVSLNLSTHLSWIP